MTSTENLWDEQLLWAKAKLYMNQARQFEPGSWLYPFWCTLALELVARAALSHIHSALLASTNDRDCSNLLYALNHGDKGGGPAPQSIGTAEVFSRCEKLIPIFTKEHRAFCLGMLGMRNEEVHSGGMSFHDLDVQKWLPRYYEGCSKLLEFCDRTLDEYVGKEDAQAAQKMIEALGDQAAKEVQGDIKAFAKVWATKTTEEKQSALAIAESSAKRWHGHVVECPACNSNSLLFGEEISSLPDEIGEDAIIAKEVMLPTSFECKACGLKIQGHNKLHASGLGSTYTRTYYHDPVEYYGIEQEYDPEPDFNE